MSLTSRALATAALFLLPAMLGAQTASAWKPAGIWTGTLRAGPIAATLHLTFDHSSEDRAGAARIVPDGPQPPLEGPIRELAVRNDSIYFSVATQAGTLRFTGAADAARAIKGQLTVVGDSGGIEARGVWTASEARPGER
jgi:hypothetical protein